MSNTKPVDVLAYLDPVIRDPHSGAQIGIDEDMQVVRAAVAELLEAAREWQQERSGARADEGSPADIRYEAALDRLDAALARCGGVS